MDAHLVKRLLDLNREFYSRFAGEFSESRASERVNLEPLLPYLGDGLRLLDVGCGNGRLAERLDRAGYKLDYVGVDVTPELVARAQARGSQLHHVRAQFRAADVTAPGWGEHSAEDTPFDLAVALAVLHHIPGLELRRRVLSEIRAELKPGSTLVLSNWQFTRNERLKKKIVPWSTLGIAESEVEPGDALIDWKRGGVGYRYCHLLAEDEVNRLAAETGWNVLRQFLADGNLNLFSILRSVGAKHP